MGNYYRGIIANMLSILLTITLFSCGGGSSESSHPPSISNFILFPDSAVLNEGGGSVSVTGWVDFFDEGGDISSVTIKAWDRHNMLIFDATFPIAPNAGTSGILQSLASLDTTVTGTYSIEVFCTDVQGSRSNTLNGTFAVVESIKTIGEYSNFQLRERATGVKEYYFYINVTNPDGSMLTDKSLIRDVKLYAHPSMVEVPLRTTNPWILWYSPYYFDEDGNGGSLPTLFPWAGVFGYPNISVGSLSEGFYKAVVTDSLGGRHEVWLYFETPVGSDRVQGASMNMNDNRDGTATLSWTNPGNIDPGKHVIYVYVNSTIDTGDGYDDLVLQAMLPPQENSYTIPAAEVTRLKGYSDLYWFVQIREQVKNVTNPDASVQDFFIYRNYSPALALNLP